MKSVIKFSVVVPLYNKEAEVVQTLNSILNQSYTADEIIIVDDGSTDKSAKIIKSTFSGVENIKLISKNNEGETAARNSGISHAKNEYIALLDADDLWEEDFLLEIKTLIERYPESIFYSTASKSIDEGGKIIKNTVRFDENFIGVIDDFSKEFSRSYGVINSSSAVIRKSIFDSGLIFPSGEKRGGDLCYWLELSLLGSLAFSAKPLSIYRLNASNRSATIHTEAIIPCPIKWFYQKNSELQAHRYYKSIRYFIYSNIFVTVYGLGLDRNYSSIKAIIELMKSKRELFWILLLPALWLPTRLLEYIKKIRRSVR